MAQYVYTMHGVGKIVPPKREILKNISLSFFPGAKIGVLGLNGSGKSTLLKIMAGLDKEIEGEATPAAGLKIGKKPASGSKTPGKGAPAGKITEAQLVEIAEKKMVDLNCSTVESAVSMIRGSARAMGLEIVA